MRSGRSAPPNSHASCSRPWCPCGPWGPFRLGAGPSPRRTPSTPRRSRGSLGLQLEACSLQLEAGSLKLPITQRQQGNPRKGRRKGSSGRTGVGFGADKTRHRLEPSHYGLRACFGFRDSCFGFAKDSGFRVWSLGFRIAPAPRLQPEGLAGTSPGPSPGNRGSHTRSPERAGEPGVSAALTGLGNGGGLVVPRAVPRAGPWEPFRLRTDSTDKNSRQDPPVFGALGFRALSLLRI